MRLLLSFLFLLTAVSGFSQEKVLRSRFKEELAHIDGQSSQEKKEQLLVLIGQKSYAHPYLQAAINIKLAEHMRKDEVDAARTYLKAVGRTFQNESYPILYSDYLVEKAYIASTDKDCEVSLEYFEKAVKLMGSPTDQINAKKLVYARNGEVVALICLGKDSLAFTVLSEIEPYVHHYMLKDSRQFVYANLGYLHLESKNNKEALKYFKDGLRFSTNASDSSRFMNNIATVYYKMDQRGRAIEYFESSLRFSKSASIESQLYKMINLGIIYMGEEYFTKALNIARRALRLAEDNHFYFFVLKSKELIANTSFYLEDYATTLELSTELISEYKRQDQTTEVQQLLELKAEALTALNRPEEAIDVYRERAALMDSLSLSNEVQNLQKMLVQFETEKKQSELKELKREQDLLRKDTEIQSLKVYALTVGIVTIVLLALVTFYFQRRKATRKRKELMLQLSRSQFDPHFLNNAFGTLQSLFIEKSDTIAAMKYVTQLSKFSRSVLESRIRYSWSLKEEENVSVNYLEIQKMRMANSFEFSFEYRNFNEKEMQNIQLPCIILQPILENCLDYNLAGKQDGAIQIVVEKNGQNISYLVQTEGVPKKVMDAKNDNEGDQVSRGTEILLRRLDVFFGKGKSGYTLELLPDRNARVELKFHV